MKRNKLISNVDIQLMNAEIKQFYECGIYCLNSYQMNSINSLGKFSVAIVNLSFACELILKYLKFRESGHFNNMHSLEDLFFSLSIDLQQKIEFEYNTILNSKFDYILDEIPVTVCGDRGINPLSSLEYKIFKKAIKNNSNHFSIYRYYFEVENLKNYNGGLNYIFNHKFFMLLYQSASKVKNEIDS